MTVLISLVLMLTSGFYMLQLNRMETGAFAESIFEENEDTNGTLYAAGIINQYFILLGEFN